MINFYSNQNSKNNSLFAFNYFRDHPLLLITVFFFLFITKNLLGYSIVRSQYKFVYDVASKLSKKNLLNYFEDNYNNYVNIDSSVHIRKISQQPIEFAHYVLRGIQQIISQSILIIITIIAILFFNAVLFPLLLLILIPPVILTGFLMKKKLNSVRKNTKTTSEKTIQHLQESIAAYIESNLYDKKDFFSNRYYEFQNKLNSFLSEQQVIQNMPSRLIEVFAVFGLFILILINSYISNTNAVQVIVIGAFMAAAYKIIPGVVKILNSVGQIKTYEFTVQDLLLNNTSAIKKGSTPDTITSVEFKNVCFRYKEEKIINDVSLKLNKGDLAAVTGISGKGKTTLINLLLGFLAAECGSIFINAVATSNTQRMTYWNRVSYVKQQSFFIHDTILKNITLHHTGYDHKKLSGIISAIGLADIISNSPNGLNTIITENGKNFSGGQRQRIMIARALYKEFDLLILDEPFSELDQASEKCLLNYFRTIAQQGKIVMLITHSNTALSFCNKTICLE